MLLCVVECCFCVPKHVSVINYLIKIEESFSEERVRRKRRGKLLVYACEEIWKLFTKKEVKKENFQNRN